MNVIHISTILFSTLLASCIYASSVPVLYCENEAASAGDCTDEALRAAESTKPWFDSYMTSHSDLKRERRHLLDCSRFCKSDTTYFTIQYPCDCQKSRRLTAVDVHSIDRTLAYDPLVGPIQLFKTFALQLPGSTCKKVLEMSRCFVTFVESYNHDYSMPENHKAANETGDIPSDYYINKSYNPQTGKFEVYDPETGEVVQPEKPSDNIDDELPDEIYDPKTDKYYPVDPTTGEIIGAEGNASPSTSNENNNDGESFDEVYDPVTKTYHKVDPNTGKYIYEEGETPPSGNEVFSEEVYDPVTGEYHKIDPVTGEYIEDVKQYEEVYDPATGEYHKIDPTTGKYVP